MQLTASPPGSIRGRLAAATCALVGVAATPVDAVEVSSAGLFYSEPDGITAIETRGSYRARLGESATLTLVGTFDSLTGASPNGAPPSRLTQTFTRASGGGSYSIAPGETPVDDSFEDSRVEGSGSLAWSLGRETKVVVGTSYSTETDYESFGFEGHILRDLFGKNTTISLGLSRALDTIDPVGGAPIPLATMRRAGLPQPKTDASEDKTVTDVVAGWTQVIDAASIVQMNYSHHRSSGYLTDPYKFVALVQAPSAASPGTPFEYVYESRPDSRTKHALFGRGKRAFDRDVLDVSYRYHWDDWGVRSHTVEGRYRWEPSRDHGFEPQLRYYHQSSADFYTHSLIDGTPAPDHVSADARLATFDSWTTALR